MSASKSDIERVARALHADDYPSGEWEHVRDDHKAKWRAMARTIVSVSAWGNFLDAAKRLAQWDDVDHKRAIAAFSAREEREKRLWLRRAEVGFAALDKRPAPPPIVVVEPLLDGFDDGA